MHCVLTCLPNTGCTCAVICQWYQVIWCICFVQAGDKVKALKCLIRSGDTEKIIFFVGVSRHPDIYTMAANYLQTLWRSCPELAQSIVTFYSKASCMSAAIQARCLIGIDVWPIFHIHLRHLARDVQMICF